MRIVSLLGVAVFVFAVFLQLRTWRRQRRVRPGLIAVSQLAALASSVAFSTLTRRPPTAEWWVVLLGAGVVLGVIYGGTMVIDRTERGVVMSYSIPAIVTWSALMVITQLATIFGRSVPIVIYSLAIANLGINLGMNGRVLWGYSTTRGAPAMGLLALTIGLILVPWLGLAPDAAAQTPEHCPEGWRVAILDDAGNEVPIGTPGASFGCLPIEGGSSDTSVPATGLNYAGTYRGSFVVFEIEDWAMTMPFTLVVEESGAASGDGSAIDSYTNENGSATVEVNFECLGSIDAAGSGRCVGDAWSRVTVTLTDQPADTQEGPATMTMVLSIAPDGSLSGYVEDYVVGGIEGQTSPIEGQAVLGGPTQTSDTVPGTGETPGSDVVPGNGETPGSDEPLSAEDTAAAVALSSLILAGGSLAQLLPLLQGGMSLQDAIRYTTSQLESPPHVVPSDPLAGLARTADGRVMFQPPWEVGSIPIDAEEARRILDLQEQGYRWTGEAGGWMTPDQEDMNRAWEARARAADAADRDRLLADQARARADLQERREALDALKRARQIVDDSSRTGVERYEMLSDQMYDLAFTPDGGIDVEYVRRMRAGLSTMLRSDLAVSDESLRQTFVSDFAESTWDDARHNALIRIGTGVVSGGQSEWFYQSQSVLEAMDRASQQGDLTVGDGLRIAYGTIAEENLPVTTIAKLAGGEDVGMLDVAGDLLKGVNVRTQARGVIAEHVPDSAGLVAWQRRAIQAEATASDAELLFRPVNPGASKAAEMPGKLPWMKQKTITADDVALLGYPKNQIGQVPGGPPRPPTGGNADEYRRAMAQYNKRAAEWAEHGATTREAIAAGRVVEVDGVLHTVNPTTGQPGAAFVADLDPADVVTAGGRRMSDEAAVRVMRNLEERGLAVGGHGSPYTWNPTTSSGEAMRANLISDIEAGKTGEWFRPGEAAGARPRWTEGAVGAGVHDAGRPEP
ncbi:MAG: hypothetical protein WD652_06105 [Acidimicrobiia bacterium]